MPRSSGKSKSRSPARPKRAKSLANLLKRGSKPDKSTNGRKKHNSLSKSLETIETTGHSNPVSSESSPVGLVASIEGKKAASDAPLQQPPGKKKKKNRGGVTVVSRFRPLNALEKKMGSKYAKPILNISDDSLCVSWSDPARRDLKIPDPAKAVFSFDWVFPTTATQEDVFKHTGAQMTEELFKGFNCTILAYGQTGTGKTWTMMGVVGTPNRGVIPRLVESIFYGIECADVNIEFAVEVSYVEIYLEMVKDLLHPAHDNLRIRETRNKGVYIEGVTETYVTCNQEVLDLMDLGARNRAIASTKMNAESSRSHSVFVLKLTQKHKEHGSTKASKLILVDLAGSEKVGKTGAEGQTLTEAMAINKSLSALGNVIKALTTGSKHVPYRDSKLTRLLSDSLGGNSKTCLVVTGSMAPYNMEETLSTLRFGKRAKMIKNKPKINEERSIAEYKQLLNEAKAKIHDQERVIQALREEIGGGPPANGSDTTATSVSARHPTRGTMGKGGGADAKETGIFGSTQDDASSDTQARRQDLSHLSPASAERRGQSRARNMTRRVSSINTIMALQARCSALEREDVQRRERNGELEDQIADAKNDLQSAQRRVEELETRVQQADRLRKEAVDGVTFVMTKRLELSQREATLGARRLDAMAKENRLLKKKLTAKINMAKAMMEETQRSVTTEVQNKTKANGDTNTHDKVTALVAGGADDEKRGSQPPLPGPATTKPARKDTPASSEELHLRNEALMEDLAKKCADLVQMRMELDEYKQASASSGGQRMGGTFGSVGGPLNPSMSADELSFQKSLLATREQTIALLEGALHDSNVFARKMYDEYDGKIRSLKNTVTRQRYIIETSLKPMKRMVKKISGGGARSPRTPRTPSIPEGRKGTGGASGIQWESPRRAAQFRADFHSRVRSTSMHELG